MQRRQREINGRPSDVGTWASSSSSCSSIVGFAVYVIRHIVRDIAYSRGLSGPGTVFGKGPPVVQDSLHMMLRIAFEHLRVFPSEDWYRKVLDGEIDLTDQPPSAPDRRQDDIGAPPPSTNGRKSARPQATGRPHT